MVREDDTNSTVFALALSNYDATLSHSLKGVSAYGSEQSKKRTVNSSLGAMSENN